MDVYLSPQTIYFDEIFDVAPDLNWDELIAEEEALCLAKGEEPLALVDSIISDITDVKLEVTSEWTKSKLDEYITEQIRVIKNESRRM